MDLNLNDFIKKINQFYLASFIIVILLCYFIWQLFLFVGFLTSYNKPPEFLIRAENYQAQVPPRAKLPDLASYNLFGVYKKKVKKKIKVSDLDVTVTGIFANSDSKLGSVALTADGQTRLYIVGSKIKNMAVIEEILDDKIIINIDGEKEYLPYNKKNLEFNENNSNKANFPPRVFQGR